MTSNYYQFKKPVLHRPLEPAAYTTSLVVRGPAVKDRFLVTDRVTGRAWWQYGAARETPADADRKRMTPDQIRVRLDTLTAASIIA